ncbi:inositol monophosphatase family protein [Rhodopirellula sp. MGV]|uniref:inositol monophosphatase family protein n=1 Tax=Rhodopirellula sp. MGV TaxID=2023130 RepID=UPI000B9685D4|nr:inositol monophosphatase family protein [Rhodopirellula sp. MGV]OYP33110.1 inositol monophosphatase [Rhodopirellula sp. MGV]PNY35159.1 inositol monophosphatase [Rhodopirellula baltica]
MPDNYQAILHSAMTAAQAGGHVLQRYWHDGIELRDKSEFGGKTYDLVSDADLESQEVIARSIANDYPDHELLGEEDLTGDITAEHLWVIDPLDGTNNFAHHIGHFAVSIGYFVDGVPTVGVVHNPISGDTYTATRGGGAFRNSQPIRVTNADHLSKSMVGCGFYYDRGDMMRSTLAAIEEFFSHDIHGIRRFGTAALDLCAVASGQFGAFFEYKLSPWDFAAGQLIVREAGGIVTNAKGDPLGLTQSSVLAASTAIHPHALAITKKHHP